MTKIKTIFSKKNLIKSGLIFVCLALVFTSVSIFNRPVAADQYDDKIRALQQDIAKYQAEQEKLNQQAVTLESTLAKLSSQRAAIQAQIDLSQAKYDKLVLDIKQTEKDIQDNRDALGITIANLYVDDDITPIEILASSSSISDYMDKQEYRNSVRDELTEKISSIKALKTKLETQKKEVAKVLSDQKSEKATLVAKQNEQQSLLDQTKGDEAKYQQLISDSEDQIAEARAIQAAIRARLNSTGGYVLIDSSQLSEYPWNSSNCPMWGYLSTGGSDGNGGDGHGYGCRQCASYVAWRFAKETGIYPSWGNAWQFTNGAKSLGYQEGGPQSGSIAVMDPATAGNVYYGHVAWVETDPYINGNGQEVIQVSQYNYDFGWGYGMYSRMELSVNAFDHYIHIK